MVKIPHMNRRRHISGLPSLPMVSERPGSFELCRLLALLLSEMKRKGSVAKAQRSYADDFNRVRSGSISQKRRKLEAGGWIERIQKTHGIMPDVYRKGTRLLRTPKLDRAWNDISKALYGKDGLFTDTLGSPAWGYQCLNPGAIATLVVLQKATESVTLPQIIRYFSPICSESTIRTGVKKLKDLGLIRDVSGVLVLSEDWSERLGLYFSENPCCLDRSIKGRQVRAVEREMVRLQVTSGALSPAEKSQLRALPCVRCGGKASQQEHFPPKRFLKDLSNQNGRHVVWAICGRCNIETREFIQTMPLLKPRKTIVVLSPNVDPWRIYRARANKLLQDWYSAVERNDHDLAIDAAQKSLNLYAALLTQTTEVVPRRTECAPTKRLSRQTGKSYGAKRRTESSQLVN